MGRKQTLREAKFANARLCPTATGVQGRISPTSPTRAWDGIVGAGVSKSLPPKLFFDLSLFYTRQESLGERYVRYVAMAERDIYPLGPDQVGIYDPQTGKLKPQYAAFVDRLRELVAGYRKLDGQAKELKVRLQALN